MHGERSINGLHPFPTTITEWSAAIDRERSRPINPQMAANVLNEIRNKGLFNLGQNHHESMARVENHHVERWRSALGLSQAEVNNMADTTRTYGYFIPSGSTLFNAANYGVLPFLSYMGSKNPFTNAAIGVAVAGGLQPLVTGIIQTPIMAALNTWIQKVAHVVSLDAAVNPKRTPAQIGADLSRATAQVADVDVQVANKLTDMALAYGAEHSPDGQHSVDAIRQILDALANDPNTDRKTAYAEHLEALGAQQIQNLLRTKDLSDDLRMSQGVQNRQWQSSKRQILPRTARAASAFVPAIGKTIEKALGVEPTPWPTVASVAVALGAMVWQHRAAGADEIKGNLQIEEKLNMLYGKEFLTEAGRKAQRTAGTPILAEHIDAAKFRGLAAGPASQTLARVGNIIGNYDKALDAQANPAKAAEYAHDLSAMQDNRLAELTPGGDALKLLHEVMGRGPDKHPFVYAAREGWQKLTMLEMSAQLGQRLGLAWTGVIFGNVGASAGSRLVTAAFGGVDAAPAAARFAGAAMSTVFGAIGAATQWMVANAKNERRSEPDRVTFLAQLANSVLGPAWQQRQLSDANHALESAAAASQVNLRRSPLHSMEAALAPPTGRSETAHETDSDSDSVSSYATAPLPESPGESRPAARPRPSQANEAQAAQAKG